MRLSKEPWDVLQQRVSWSNLAKHSRCFWPEVPFVVGSLSLPGNAEGLAWESCGDDDGSPASQIAIWREDSGVEGSDIVENRSVVEVAFADSGMEYLSGVWVEVAVEDRLPSEQVAAREQAAACPAE